MKDDELIAELASELRDAGEDFAVLPEHHLEHVAIMRRFEDAFPVAGWGRIDWQRMRTPICTHCDDDDELVRRFAHLCNETLHLSHDVRCCVMWTNALRPIVRVQIGTLLKHALAVFQTDFDTWIFPDDTTWCIENYHEGELCFGRRP